MLNRRDAMIRLGQVGVGGLTLPQLLATRQATADGRLADTHQADEDDWTVEAMRQFTHSKGLYSAMQRRQKRRNRRD